MHSSSLIIDRCLLVPGCWAPQGNACSDVNIFPLTYIFVSALIQRVNNAWSWIAGSVCRRIQALWGILSAELQQSPKQFLSRCNGAKHVWMLCLPSVVLVCLLDRSLLLCRSPFAGAVFPISREPRRVQGVSPNGDLLRPPPTKVCPRMSAETLQ